MSDTVSPFIYSLLGHSLASDSTKTAFGSQQFSDFEVETCSLKLAIPAV